MSIPKTTQSLRWAWPSADGLRVVFTAYDDAGNGNLYWNIYETRRATPADAFGAPTHLAGAAQNQSFAQAVVTNASAEELWYSEAPLLGGAFRIVRRAAAATAPVAVDLGTHAGKDMAPVPTPDGLGLYFASDRAGTFDVWLARRAQADAPFGAPAPVAELSTAESESPSWLSADGCRLYLARGNSVLVAER